jgi:hypothetical protein
MIDPPEVHDGDRVRVVLEGEARSVLNQDDRRFNISTDTADISGSNTIHPDDAHVVSVEVLPPPIDPKALGVCLTGRAVRRDGDRWWHIIGGWYCDDPSHVQVIGTAL